jgi:hypothetical protein
MRPRGGSLNRLNHEAHLINLENGPLALATYPGVNIVLRMSFFVRPLGIDFRERSRFLTTGPVWDCLIRKSHCNILLAATLIATPKSETILSGLFGMFGEERMVFVDIHDTAKIDQLESYLSQLKQREKFLTLSEDSFFPDESSGYVVEPRGAGRYGSEARSVLGYERKCEAKSALSVIKHSWLEANGCFKPAENPLLPWTGDSQRREWDDQHPVAKSWLSKLPTFSFVAMYQVTEWRFRTIPS